MSALTDIREQPPGQLQLTQEGYTQQRRYKVFARSEIEAIGKLQRYRGVFIGSGWVTTYGETPDASVVCRTVSIDMGSSVPAPLNGDGDYMVVCDFEKPGKDEAVAGGGPIYRLDTSLQSAAIDQDADGDPITNLVEEPIDTKDFEDREVLRIEWWAFYASLSVFFQTIRPYRNSLNLVSWQGLARGWARLGGVQNTEEVYVDTGVWVKQKTSIEIREGIDTAAFASQIIDKDGNVLNGVLEGWGKLRRHEGTREKGDIVDGVQQYTPILTEDGGDQIREPVPLDASGQRLAAAATPIAIYHNVVPKYRDFNLLGI